ncbi:hypothetical protein M5K25_020157 [Dendrobium thyrsiflorum]|uniref:Uncharacterized protein n=1 Tax=Dendrobium thyrsiflorum TaxID=117978 RepID=A0ABD0U946_DENTH
MSPNQGPEALLKGSNQNLSYQTVSKRDVLIVESSGSTRRIQRAQDHIEMSIKRGSISAVRSNHSENTPDLSLIYEPCHSQKSINRALILLEKGPKLEGKRRRREGRDSSSTTVGVRQATARRRNFAGLPPGLQATPEFRPAYNFIQSLTGLLLLGQGLNLDVKKAITIFVGLLPVAGLLRRWTFTSHWTAASSPDFRQSLDCCLVARLSPVIGLLPVVGLSSDIYPTLNFLRSLDFCDAGLSPVTRMLPHRQTFARRRTSARGRTLVGLLPDAEFLPNAVLTPVTVLLPVVGLLPDVGLTPVIGLMPDVRFTPVTKFFGIF